MLVEINKVTQEEDKRNFKKLEDHLNKILSKLAKEDAINEKDDNIPPHLKNYEFASKEDKEKRGLYKYPHNYGGYVEQQYLPDKLAHKKYYQPTDNGYEKVVKEIRKNKGKKV